METLITTEIEPAISLLKKGGVVAFPTETVYGLGGSALREEAIEKIYTVKGRPRDNPLIVHIVSLEQALSLVFEPSPSFFDLANRYWPGPLTLVVRRASSLPASLSAGRATVALRMPEHPLARKIIEGVGEPLAAPSANLSGRPSPTRAFDVWEDLQGKIPLIVDGGDCSIGIESTVLSLVHSRPILLRPGAIRKEEIEAFLGCSIALPSSQEEGLSPGMKYRHYAPKATVRLVFCKGELKGPYVLSRPSAFTLYRALRQADRLGVAEIEVYCDEEVQGDVALMDRLMRAAGHVKECL